MNEEFEAFVQAMEDLGESNFSEEQLESFYDEIKSSKSDVFYEDGDGAFEIDYKKMISLINEFKN
jgi:hypothetical protein